MPLASRARTLPSLLRLRTISMAYVSALLLRVATSATITWLQF
jgi:hypothetical protein